MHPRIGAICLRCTNPARDTSKLQGGDSGMRSIFGTLISCALATLVAGCNLLTDFRYSREGIGSELFVADSVPATEHLESYVGLLCRQAGLPRIVNSDGTFSCAISETSSADWSLIVQAGMNDIDGRCDAYLAWLDDKRRSNEPFLKQLAATSAATLGILDATSVGVKAITITGIAFGLAANTFTNFNARILSLEQSTIQSVVLDSQHNYRQNNNPSLVSSRPAAVYYLRNYLRICLPFSIETTVNNTVTVFHRAGPGALGRNGNTLFTRTVVTDSTKRFARQPEGPINNAPDILDPHERSLSADQIEGFQLALCQTDDGILGRSGSETRKAIIAYLAEIGSPSATGAVTRRVSVLLGKAVRLVGDCKKSAKLTDRTPAGVGKLVKGPN
jgi:hypothetical protein